MRKSCCVLMFAAVIVLFVLPVFAVNGTVAGSITSDEAGTPALAGALVRTDGDPAYPVISGSDGSYSLVAPEGTYTLLVSAAGHNPQRFPIIITGGSILTVNAALRPSSGAIAVSLPAPLDWGEPANGPSAPGDSFPVAFTDMGAMPVSGAPRVSEWTKMVKPDESFTISGSQFTTRTGSDSGTDTTVWVWARTSASGGVLKQAKIWKVTENTITALMSDDIPFGMYLLWVENSTGVSSPICLNRTNTKWVGPLGNTVQAGGKKRVLGCNISYNHGTSTSYVYMQPTSGGSYISCPTSSANPYMVEFTVPAGTANGNYKVYVHNGQGGIYGWGDGLDLIVADDWVRGTNQVSLSPNGTNDTTAIQNAIDQMSALPNGGTVNLASGTFKTYAQIWVKGKVRLIGAGMNATTIELRSNVYRLNDYVIVHGDHIVIQDLTLKACLDTNYPPIDGIIGSPYPSVTEANDIKYVSMRLTGDIGTLLFNNPLGWSKVEVAGCEFYRGVGPGMFDGWMHDCTMYGGPYGIYSPPAPVYLGETEDAIYGGTRSAIEYCHVETKDWPTNPVNGSRNYQDFLTYDQYGYQIWAKRVLQNMYGGASNLYLAHITTKDVAVQDNKGEMVLFHPMGGQWFGNVLSASGLTLNLRTDGLVDGQVVFIDNVGMQMQGSVPVPDGYPLSDSLPTNGGSAVVIAGRGTGQARLIVSHTATSVTVDRPWRIQPDSTSKISIATLYTNNVIYSNDLNAFPVGYDQRAESASRAVAFTGAWENWVEGVTSHRTHIAPDITGGASFASYWNVFRDVQTIDCCSGGFAMYYYWHNNPYGPMLFANALHDCGINIYSSGSFQGVADMGATYAYGEATVIENMTVSAKRGYNMTGVAVSGYWPDGLVLYRKGHINVIDGPASPSTPQPAYIAATDGKQFLINNSYSGASQNYFLASGLLTYSVPVAMYRVAKFTGNVGYSIPSQIVPIANAGTAAMAWTVTPSDSWITASVQANGTLSPESTLGRLVIAVDTTGLSAGRHWGSVSVNTASTAVKIGVCVDLASGPPANRAPVASFTATPTAGVTPLTVALNGSASSDVDGAVASYYWDFGDGSYGSGMTASHTYTTPSTYTPVLTVTDDDGAASSSWSNANVYPALSAVTLEGTPVGAINTSTPVTLTATATGGCLLQYKFLVKGSSGWSTLRDYASGNSYTWTPAAAGYYEIKVYARSTGSTSAYDGVSATLGYPVGLLPSGMKLWLKADAGISASDTAVTSWADQSGTGNNVAQTNVTIRPTIVTNAVNGKAVVRFTGPSRYLQSANQVLNGNTAFTAFTVAKINQIPTSNPYQYFWWNGADAISGGYGCYLSNSGYLSSAWGSYSGAVSDTNNAAIGSLYRICSRFNGTNGTGPHYMWINGVSVPSKGKSGSNLSGGMFTVGDFGPTAGSGLYGDIAEIMIYDRALTDAERVSVDQYLQLRWVPPTPTAVDRIKDVKALGDGVLVSITSPKVATVASGVFSDGGVYVQETDRTAGLKITGAGTVNLWDNLTLTGTTDTDAASGERVLRVTTVATSSGAPSTTLGMSGKAFSASGQLVKVWGRVTDKTGGYITIDDGSGTPVKAQIDGLVSAITKTVNTGGYISVTGPAGLASVGIPVVRPRSDIDIQVY